MKKQFSTLFILLLLVSARVIAQSPSSFNYQTALRDGSGAILATQAVELRFTIKDSSAGNPAVVKYRETKSGTTTAQGMFTHQIGTGTVDQGAFGSIGFVSGDKYLQVEVSVAGGPYINMGTQQLVSVPFAIYAEQAANSQNASNANNASYATTAGHANSADHAITADTATYATNANNATNAVNATNATTATTSLDNKWTQNGPNEIRGPFSTSATVNGQYLTVNSGGEATVRLTNQGNPLYLTNGGFGFSPGVFSIGNGTALFNVNTLSNYVGIGVSAAYPLEVSGTNNGAYGFFSQLTSSGASTVNPVTTFNLTAVFHGAVSADRFVAYSDARLKKIDNRSVTSNDLSLINKLQVTDYHYIDMVSKGKAQQKGFIAQEVEKLIPDAITTTNDFIPSIYAIAEKVTNTDKGNTALTTKAPHNLKVGDTVRLITDKQREYAVTAVTNANTFEVNSLPQNTTQVFVYGKKVNDLHEVDYNNIFTTGIGAIQELSKQVEQLQAEKTALQKQVEGMNTANATLKADVEQIKQQLGLSAEVAPKK